MSSSVIALLIGVAAGILPPLIALIIIQAEKSKYTKKTTRDAMILHLQGKLTLYEEFEKLDRQLDEMKKELHNRAT